LVEDRYIGGMADKLSNDESADVSRSTNDEYAHEYLL
jgi:hypothetical protein